MEWEAPGGPIAFSGDRLLELKQDGASGKVTRGWCVKERSE